MNVRAASLLALVLAWTCAASIAHAHPTPGSVALIDFTVDGARIEQNVPIEELERALHQPLAGDGEAANIVARHEALLRDYAAGHVLARSADGGAWTTTVTRVTGIASDDGPRALFSIALRAPSGEAASSLEL